jgi:hypothetical protein
MNHWRWKPKREPSESAPCAQALDLAPRGAVAELEPSPWAESASRGRALNSLDSVAQDPLMTEESVVTDDQETPSSGRRLSFRARLDLIFDFILLLAFGIVFSLDFTGEEWHEWLGLAFGLALLVHLTLHWDWVVRTARRILTTTGRRRFTFIVNLLLCFDLVLCVGSGILISRYALPSLGINFFATSDSWTNIHEKSADVAIALIAIHVAIDWRWVVNVTKRTFYFRRRTTDGRGDVKN